MVKAQLLGLLTSGCRTKVGSHVESVNWRLIETDTELM